MTRVRSSVRLLQHQGGGPGQRPAGARRYWLPGPAAARGMEAMSWGCPLPSPKPPTPPLVVVAPAPLQDVLEARTSSWPFQWLCRGLIPCTGSAHVKVPGGFGSAPSSPDWELPGDAGAPAAVGPGMDGDSSISAKPRPELRPHLVPLETCSPSPGLSASFRHPDSKLPGPCPEFFSTKENG